MNSFVQPDLFRVPAHRNWPFGKLEPHSYRVIYADPPWRFQNWSPVGEGRNAVRHYACMNLLDIAALPVGDLAHDDCALLMWATGPFACLWPDVMKAWSFTFSGKGFCWVKPWPKACEGPVDDITADANWAMTTGYGTRHNSEDCWLGRIGNPRRLDMGVRELIVAPPREHSRKPEEAYARIERLFAGPYVELFSRTNRPGWDAWGDEAGKFDGDTAVARSVGD